VGGGFGYFKKNSTLEFGGPNPGKTGTTSGLLQLGAGLDVKQLKGLLLLTAASKHLYRKANRQWRHRKSSPAATA
jgi:hypothetical protein